MIKEKIDRQKTGQSSVTPFMRVNECSQSSEESGKKGMTFDVIETLERHSDSIDKLTSLVSKMNVKMDRKETSYKPKVYQNIPRGQGRGRQQNFQPHNRSFNRDRNTNRGNYNYNNRNNRPNYRDRSRDNYRHDDRRHNYQSNERHKNYRPDNSRRDKYRQDSRNRQNYRGDNSRQRYGDRSESRDRSRNYSSDRARSRDISRDRDGQVQNRSRTLSNDREGSRSRSNSRTNINRDRLRCYRCGEYDHFAQECPYTLMDDEMGHSDSEPVSIQMLTQEDLPLNFDGEVEYLNL